MIEFLTANMAPIMFGSLIVFLMFGYAVAFSLAACGLFFGLVGIELGMIQPAFLQSLPLRMFGIMQNDTLLAIPFFTFMGLILERSGMAEDLLDTIGQLFGPIRGGLAYAVILVGAMLGYSFGYQHGDAGEPSLKRRALEVVGVYKVKEDHAQRQRVLDEIQRARADSIESAIHRSAAAQ